MSIQMTFNEIALLRIKQEIRLKLYYHVWHIWNNLQNQILVKNFILDEKTLQLCLINNLYFIVLYVRLIIEFNDTFYKLVCVNLKWINN